MLHFHIFQAGYASRCITHAHFTAWPDKDVPDTSWHLVNFWRKIESTSSNDDVSIVVHCRYHITIVHNNINFNSKVNLSSALLHPKIHIYIGVFHCLTKYMFSRDDSRSLKECKKQLMMTFKD